MKYKNIFKEFKIGALFTDEFDLFSETKFNRPREDYSIDLKLNKRKLKRFVFNNRTVFFKKLPKMFAPRYYFRNLKNR